jgi:hypothetical protein
VAIPILDEVPALVSALETLARAPGARATIGQAARLAWQAAHTVAAMADAYVSVLGRAALRRAAAVTLPPHLTDTGDRVLREVLTTFGTEAPDIVRDRRD